MPSILKVKLVWMARAKARALHDLRSNFKFKKILLSPLPLPVYQNFPHGRPTSWIFCLRLAICPSNSSRIILSSSTSWPVRLPSLNLQQRGYSWEENRYSLVGNMWINCTYYEKVYFQGTYLVFPYFCSVESHHFSSLNVPLMVL